MHHAANRVENHRIESGQACLKTGRIFRDSADKIWSTQDAKHFSGEDCENSSPCLGQDSVRSKPFSFQRFNDSLVSKA